MMMEDSKEGNLSKAESMLEEAADKGAEICCLPELFCYRYFPQERHKKVKPEKIPGYTTDKLCNVAKRLSISLVAGSIYEYSENGKYNTSVIIDKRGIIAGKYRKIHIPQDECFYEQDYFKSGESYHVVNISGIRVGVLICFDQWYPEPARILKLRGADMIFYPSAIGTVDGINQVEGSWKEAWEAVQRGHAISNSIVVATVNRTGTEQRMDFWGGSFVYDQFGKKIASAGKKEKVLIASCDLSLSSKIEEGWGFMRNRKPSTYGELVWKKD
jgi:predicted amidohydrolase